MKIGAEDNTKTRWAIGLLAIGLACLGYALWPSSTTTSPPAPVAPSVSPGASARPLRRGRTTNERTAVSNDPSIHLALLDASEDVKYSGAKRNIFQGEGEETPEQNQKDLALLQAKKCKITPDAPGCPGYDPCKANPSIQGCPGYKPPIDLKFYGFASRPGEPKRVFLSQGEQIFVAKEGDVVARRYKVVKIGVNSVQIEDMPNNNTQTLPLTAG